jgi:hypothetical protein
MAIARTESTALGLLLLLLIPAAILVLPEPALSVLTLSLASIAVVEGIFRRYRESKEKRAESPVAKQTAREIFSVSDAQGPPTEGVLSLIDALESSRQTVVVPDVAPSVKPSNQGH